MSNLSCLLVYLFTRLLTKNVCHMKQNHKKQYAPPALRVADLFPESRILISGSTGSGKFITNGGDSKDNPSTPDPSTNKKQITDESWEWFRS